VTPEEIKKLQLMQQLARLQTSGMGGGGGIETGYDSPSAQWIAFMNTMAGPASWAGGNAVGDSSAPAGFGFSMPERGSALHSIQSAVVQALAKAVPAVRASDDEAQYDALAEFGAPTKARSIADALNIALSVVPMLGMAPTIGTPLKAAVGLIGLIEKAVSFFRGPSKFGDPPAFNKFGEEEEGDPGALGSKLGGFSLGDPSLGDPSTTGPLGGVGSLAGPTADTGSPTGTMGTVADAAAAALAGAIADAAAAMSEGATNTGAPSQGDAGEGDASGGGSGSQGGSQGGTQGDSGEGD
jgi:hypothetical protein